MTPAANTAHLTTFAGVFRAFQYPSTPLRAGEERRREAVERVTQMQFDRHGNRVWRQAQALLDTDHLRRAIGKVTRRGAEVWVRIPVGIQV
ncbi:hypothetical protein FBY35_0105 [Streptomyces sp. SLBN-118]|nr:hypothetical protein FBY35_0105 [Streptomyces sp. SLBN-118]